MLSLSTSNRNSRVCGYNVDEPHHSPDLPNKPHTSYTVNKRIPATLPLQLVEAALPCIQQVHVVA